jgi:hypothetical protein
MHNKERITDEYGNQNQYPIDGEQLICQAT